MGKVKFSIPGRPRAKDRPRATVMKTKHGPMARVYTPKGTVTAENEIAQRFKIAARGHKLWTGPIMIKIILVFKIPKAFKGKRLAAAHKGKIWSRDQIDADNAQKLILDALNEVAWVDDRQVAVIQMAKRYGRPERTDIEISQLAQEPHEITDAQKAMEKKIHGSAQGRFNVDVRQDR